ncbi:MAG: serine protease [Selenomonadales bacterium]|nr:serine protease [Selenomonadales bacterium]
MAIFADFHTMMNVLLLAVVFIAILTEIKTAGMGVGAIIGLVGAGIFFYAQSQSGTVGWWEIGLFLLGTLFLLMEILFTGVGLFAVLGISSIFVSLIWAMGGDVNAVKVLLAGLVLAIILFALIATKLPSSKLWERVVLRETESAEAGYNSVDDHGTLVGKEGIVISELRPSGKVEIDGNVYDVVSSGPYLEEGERVVVAEAVGMRIVVRRVK